MSFCNSTSCQQEVNGAKIQLFAQQLKYFKHFFSLKVLFFYQNGNFEHFLLKNVYRVQRGLKQLKESKTSIFYAEIDRHCIDYQRIIPRLTVNTHVYTKS